MLIEEAAGGSRSLFSREPEHDFGSFGFQTRLLTHLEFWFDAMPTRTCSEFVRLLMLHPMTTLHSHTYAVLFCCKSISCQRMGCFHITRLLVLTATVALSLLAERTSAFQVQREGLTHGVANIKVAGRSRPLLFLSDIPQNNDEVVEEEDSEKRVSLNTSMQKWKIEAPPAPEDMFTLIGDLIALTVYGFTDHFVCNDISTFMVHKATTIPQLERLLPTTYTDPVWADAAQHQQMMQHAASDLWIIQYSGPLMYTGSAVVLLASCWLLAGYLMESFAFSNTLECRTDHALVTTLRTWMVATFLAGCVVMAFSSSDAIVGKPDMIFLADSLSVLTLWRFLANALFGSYRE